MSDSITDHSVKYNVSYCDVYIDPLPISRTDVPAMISTFLREKDFSGYYRMIALTRYPCRIMFVSIAEV